MMKVFPITIIASVAALGACAPQTTTRVETAVTATQASTEALGLATGLPAESIVALSRTGDQYVVFYREDAVTAEQLAAAPATICANTDATVFGAEPVDLTAPQFSGGVQRMTVTCS